MTKEVMKQALEALEINLVFLRNVKPFKGQEDLASDCVAMTEEIISTLEEALKQEQDEPVAKMVVTLGEVTDMSLLKEVSEFLDGTYYLYNKSQPNQEQDEPVAWMSLMKEARDNCKASIVEDGISAMRKEYRVDLERRLTDFINTYPQPRKPLTNEQLFVLLSKIDEHAVRLPSGLRKFAREIETAHGIKE